MSCGNYTYVAEAMWESLAADWTMASSKRIAALSILQAAADDPCINCELPHQAAANSEDAESPGGGGGGVGRDPA